MLVQRAISSRERRQPWHRRSVPIVQMLTHGLTIDCAGTMVMKSGSDTRLLSREAQSAVNFALRKSGIGPFQP